MWCALKVLFLSSVCAHQLPHLHNLFCCGCHPTVSVLFLLPAQQLKFKWREANRVTNNMLWYTFSWGIIVWTKSFQDSLTTGHLWERSQSALMNNGRWVTAARWSLRLQTLQAFVTLIVYIVTSPDSAPRYCREVTARKMIWFFLLWWFVNRYETETVLKIKCCTF